jgi:hypothetical protein
MDTELLLLSPFHDLRYCYFTTLGDECNSRALACATSDPG